MFNAFKLSHVLSLSTILWRVFERQQIRTLRYGFQVRSSSPATFTRCNGKRVAIVKEAETPMASKASTADRHTATIEGSQNPNSEDSSIQQRWRSVIALQRSIPDKSIAAILQCKTMILD